MINELSISLVIPCRNEEKALKKMLASLPSSIDEVIVVDNGSTDQTKQIAEQCGAKVISELRQHHGIGYGYAHQSGFAAAQSDLIVTMDGDNTYPTKDIPKVVKFLLKNDFDFVSCNRFPLSEGHAISWIRQLGVRILNLESAIFYNYKVQDILSGMWVFKKEILHKISLQEGGWNLSPEIKLKSIMANDVLFAEYYIDHYFRFDGQSKQKIWKTGFEHLLFIANLRFVTLFSSIANRMRLPFKKQDSAQNTIASE